MRTFLLREYACECAIAFTIIECFCDFIRIENARLPEVHAQLIERREITQLTLQLIHAFQVNRWLLRSQFRHGFSELLRQVG